MQTQELEAKAHNLLPQFFQDLAFNLITVSVQPSQNRQVKLHPGKWFSIINRVRAVPPEIYFSDTFQKELQYCNNAGCELYFMINEGDGKPAEGSDNLNCGKRKNVINLNTLVIDTDEGDIEKLLEKLVEIKLLPHYIINSSKDKYHLYFLLEKEPATGDNICYWEALIRYLAKLVPELDQTMDQTNQVLRIPGFYNLKYDTPLKITFNKQLKHEKYKLKELYDRLGASKYYDLDKRVLLNGTGTGYTKFEYPTEKLQAGTRRNTITRYIAHIMENTLPLTSPDEHYFLFVDDFIKKYVTEPQHYLEGGKIRQNLKDYLRDERNRRIKNQFDRDSYLANQKLNHVENVSNKALPDEFYLTFPGDLGMLTREIHNYAPNLSLELCFAGSLIVSGALKVESFRFKGAWPIINGLIIAGTGEGKSTLKDIVERTLSIAGLRGKYPQVFGFQNSVQSLHTSLYSAGGAGTVIVDESGDYLDTITSKNAPGYAKALKKYFKESTTGKDKGTWLHPGGSLAYQVPAIDGGMLSLWMLIQPDRFEGSMNLEDMSDGFLPRFFIFNGKMNIALTRFIQEESGTKTFKPSLDLEVYLQSFTTLIPQINVTSVLESVEKEIKESQPKAKAEFIASAKRDAIYEARSEARALNNLNVEIEPNALRLVIEYLKEREQEAKNCYNLQGDSAPALAIYVRMEEMLMRLMCNAVSFDNISRKAVIDTRLATSCIEFHRFQTDRFITNEVAEMSKGEGEKDLQTVLKAFIKAFADNGHQPVQVSQIVRCMRFNKRPKNTDLVLDKLVKRGNLFIEAIPSKRHRNKTVVHYIPGNLGEID